MTAEQAEMQRKIAEQALKSGMSEREKALLGILAQTNPQVAAQFLQGGGQQDIGDAFNALTPQEREQLYATYGPDEHGISSTNPSIGAWNIYQNRKKSAELKRRLKLCGLSPDQVSAEYDRIFGG